MDHEQTFGEWLKDHRAAVGLSQRQVAELSGIPLRTVQEYEQGRCKPSMDRGITLMSVLGVVPETERAMAS